MPKMNENHLQGGPTQPVYVMNHVIDAPTGPKSAVGGITSTSGNNTIVAAPGAGFRLILWAWHLGNGAATANTCTIRDLAARFSAPLGAAIGSNMGQVFPWGYRLNENAALTLALAAATSVSYNFIYSTEAV